MFKRIISFVLVIAIVFCFAVPSAFAITEYYSEPVTWGDYVLTGFYNYGDEVWDEDSPLPFIGTAIKGIATSLNSKICQESHDGYHASLAKFVPDEAFGIDEHGRYALLICEYCGDYFRCYSSDLIAAHDEYVASLDSTTANSILVVTGFSCTTVTSKSYHSSQHTAGRLFWSSGQNALDLINSIGINDRVIIEGMTTSVLYGSYFDSDGIFKIATFLNPFSAISAEYCGVYKLSDLELLSNSNALVYDGTYFHGPVFFDKSYAVQWASFNTESCVAFAFDEAVVANSPLSSFYVWRKQAENLVFNEHLYKVGFYYGDSSLLSGAKEVPTSDIVWDNSHIVVAPPNTTSASRSSSLMQTINNYNVDNSVVDNSSNVNYYISPKSYVTELPDDTIDIEQCYSPQSYDEETLVFTEPVTGAQILSSGWTYNYETRTYDIAVPAGTTTDTLGSDITRIELIYGDEAVTYNYYLADDTLAQSDDYAYVMVSGDETFGTGGSSGDDNAGDDNAGDSDEEETHKHSYTDTVTTEPTCEAPGIRKYTCDECGDSYTEKIDAAGHTWTVKQSVATQYDDTGAVTVQGYTIYKCSVCNTEYKDEAGTGPPNNSADNTDGEGIFKKIGQLLGSILSGLLGMIEAVLGGLLDGLVRLANLLGDKLTQVVEIVTGLFDKIPQLFGGFTALLGDVFVFIPEDIMTIFTFGAAAIVFVGILMLFIKR